MKTRQVTTWTVVVAVLGLATLASAGAANAHCDGLDGPVVTVARKALESGEADLVLAWVPEKDEGEIRHAFERTRAVRKLGAEAKELADTWFFETLVRIHRAGEGEPYTGLKPAGRDLGPALPLADRALENGDVEPLLRLIVDRGREGVNERFDLARKARNHPVKDVAAGRAYVHRYVDFIHYADGLWQAAARAEAAHAEAPEHHH